MAPSTCTPRGTSPPSNTLLLPLLNTKLPLLPTTDDAALTVAIVDPLTRRLFRPSLSFFLISAVEGGLFSRSESVFRLFFCIERLLFLQCNTKRALL